MPSFMVSQTISIKDKSTDEALEYVSLISEDPKVFETTNARGQADVSAFKGSEKIQIRILSHKTIVMSYEELVASDFEVRLEASSVHIDEVVVSANKWNQNSSDVPSRIVSISPKNVAFQNPQTAADLLGSSGEVFIQKSQQGGGSPMIRGFATNRLLYTIDGVRMNTAIFRSGNIQNVISLDPFAIEHTEVVFGPSSVIYGSDAIGAVMSFQTLTPRLSLNDKTLVSGNAALRFATANLEKTAHADVNLGWKKWASVTSLTFTDYDDLRMGSYGLDDYLKPVYVERQGNQDVVLQNDDDQLQIPSAYSQVNFMQKIRFKASEKWDFQYGFHYSETSEYGRYDRHLRQRNGLPRYAEWNYGPQKWLMNNLNISHKGENVLYDLFTIRLAQQHFEESRISRSLNDVMREIRIERVEAYSLNLDLKKSFSEKNTLTYGAEYVVNEVNSVGMNENIELMRTSKGPARYPNSTWSSAAIYLSDQHKLSEKVLLQSGLRYSLYMLDSEFDTTFYDFPFKKAEINDGALTGSFGIVCKPNRTWVISTNAATAFRSPNVDDIGKVFDSEPGSVVVPNPDLQAEYAYNVDFNVAKVFSDVVKLDASVYYTILKNAMVRRDYTLNGQDSIIYDGVMSKVQAIQNAAEARVYGFEIGMEVKLPKGFTLSSHLNYQEGEEELDDGSKSPSRHAAPIFGVSRLHYRYKKFDAELYSVYSGGRRFDDLPEEEKGKTEIYALDTQGRPFAPSWYTFNLKFAYKFNKYLTANAGVENLLDARYKTYSSGIVAPGRNFILALRTQF